MLEGKLPDYVIIGIGLNINQKEFSIDNATSLSLETEYSFKIEDVRNLFINHLLKELSNFANKKDTYIDEFNKHNYLLNKEISYFDVATNENKKGIALDINQSGELLVNNGEKIITVSSSEVSKIH